MSPMPEDHQPHPTNVGRRRAERGAWMRDRVRALEAEGLTSGEMAQRLGLPRSTVSSIRTQIKKANGRKP